MLPSRLMRIRTLSVCLLIFATACGGSDPKGKPAAGKSSSPEPPKPVFCPLTGVETSRDAPIARPALGVKIENSVASRPQVGLEQADIVYEELAEGGITRFLAVFHCTDAPSLGPIRSGRMVDPDILLEYAPVLFALSGANDLVLKKIDSTKGVANLRHGNHGSAYRRERGRKAPHDLFSSTSKLRDLDDGRGIQGPPKIGLIFDVGATGTVASPSPKATKPSKTPASPSPSPSPSPSTPPPGSSVKFDYSGNLNAVKYTFDAAANAYLRFHGETPHKAASGAQLKAVNVLVMKVKVTEGTIKDAAGNSSPEISVLGKGEVTVLRGGVAVVGQWARASLAEKTVLTDATGKPIHLLPGNTWIHLIPIDRKVTVQ